MTTRDFPRVRRAGSVLALLGLTVLTASCGTRVDSAGSTAAATPASARSAGADVSAAFPADQGGSQAGETAAALPSQAAAAGAAATTPAPGAAMSSRAATGSPGRPTTSGQPSTAATPGAPRPEAATPASPTAGAAGQPTSGAGLPVESGKKSPLVVATMCNCSGPPSSAALPIVQGGQLWVKAINAKGGLNGHPVRQILYDDGSDPARNRSQVQQAVEREGAVAFFVEAAPLSAGASVDYLTSKGIPVVGTDLADPWDYQSPMYFPQGSADRLMVYGAIAGAAQQLVPAGKTKLAIVYCAEADQCNRIQKAATEFAPKVGLEVVYNSPVSLAQPDYTAVCLSARNAGAQVTAVFADVNSVSRFAASCTRQGFRPVYTGGPPTVADRFKDDPNIESWASGVNVFPFFQSGTPATDEYQEALRTQGGGKVIASVGTAMGWVGGKLLQRAGAELPEPPTSEAILKGLWALNNDDLGGLTHPLTFTSGQPAPKLACWFNIVTKGGNWVSPDGFQRHCATTPVS